MHHISVLQLRGPSYDYLFLSMFSLPLSSKYTYTGPSS
jgi:hypothetical protein